MMQQTRKQDLFGTVKESGLMGGTTGQKGGVGGLGAPGGLAGGATGPLPRKEGWLTKLGFSSGKWKQRWFTLNDTGFFYQNAPGQPEKGRLYLDEETVIYPATAGIIELGAEAVGAGKTLKTPVPENTFTVTSKWWGGDGTRTFYFTAQNAEDCEMWMLELHNYILGKPPSGPVLQPLAAPGGFLGATSSSLFASVVSKSEAAASTSIDDLEDLSLEPTPAAEHKARVPVGGSKQLPLFPKDPTKPGSDRDLAAALEDLEKNHLPKGMAGFVVSELPEMGSLGEQYGLQVYDLIYEVEGVPLRAGATKEEFGAAKEKAFQKKGSFSFRVHNFLSNSSHTVTIIMPPGKHNAILGITTSPLPYTADAIAKAKGEVLYVKGFVQQDGLFVASPKAYPLLASCTEENAGVYCQVFRQQGASMVASQIFHPLYKYGKLTEPLFVEVWRLEGPVMVQTAQKYAQLPLTRDNAKDRSA